MNAILKRLTTLSLALWAAFYALNVTAQQIAITPEGQHVVLYDNGTWRYANRHEIDYSSNWGSLPRRDRFAIRVAPNASFKNVRMTINDEVSFVVENGILRDFSIISRDYYDDEYIGIDPQDGRMRIERETFSDRVKRVGPYVIEYNFDKVRKIGPFVIEYDFFSDKLKRIGDCHIEYDFFEKQPPKVRGRVKGLQLYIY